MLQTSTRRSMVVAILVLGVVVLCPMTRADDGTKPSGVFFEPLEVPLVSLDVYVFDRNGRPVPGLTVEDFEVLEDGEPVDISHFFDSGAQAVQAGPAADGDAVQAPAAAPAPAAAAPEDPSQSLFLVVYVDEINFTRTRRQAAIRNLRMFFEQDLPEDLRVMLVSYRGAATVRQSLTDDPELLFTAIEAMEDEVSINAEMQRGGIIREMQNLVDPGKLPENPLQQTKSSDVMKRSIESVLVAIDNYASEQAQRTRLALASLKDLLRSMSGLPGRKAVLYVSDGIEMRPGEDMYILWEREFPTMAGEGRFAPLLKSRRENLKPEIEEVIELANSYRVSFYTMSTIADTIVQQYSAEFKGVGSGSGLEILPMSSEEAFMDMTAGTGGRALANNAKLAEHLVEVAEELGSYYSLGYRPSEAKVGSYHRIKVKVIRDGVNVRHREGYRVKAIQERMADRTLSAAIHGIAENPLGIRVEATGGKRQDDGSYTVPILIKVPIGQLVLMPQQTSHQGQISVYLAVRDLTGDLSDVQHRQYPVEIPNDQLLSAISQEAGFAVGLRMREGEQVVAIGVRDELANIESLVTIDVVVGDTSA